MSCCQTVFGNPEQPDLAYTIGLPIDKVIEYFGAKGMDTGTSSDLEEATHQAYFAIANLGMDEELGFVHTDTLTHKVNPQFFQEVVERQVRVWIDKATKMAGELVEANWQQIETPADILTRREIVDGAELERIMDEKRRARSKKAG